jgi:hypothetical protein
MERSRRKTDDGRELDSTSETTLRYARVTEPRSIEDSFNHGKRSAAEPQRNK